LNVGIQTGQSDPGCFLNVAEGVRFIVQLVRWLLSFAMKPGQGNPGQGNAGQGNPGQGESQKLAL
jgi:hypothetical protein